MGYLSPVLGDTTSKVPKNIWQPCTNVIFVDPGV